MARPSMAKMLGYATAISLALGSAALAGSPGDSAQQPRSYTAPPAPSYARVLERELCHGQSRSMRCMVVLVDHLRPIQLAGQVHAMLVGNPAIADANMVTPTQAVVTAKTVGSTNVLFLSEDGGMVGQYQIIVREPDLRRVTLRRGPADTQMFQCAPRCERTLAQVDAPARHDHLQKMITDEFSINAEAMGEQDTSADVDVGGGM